MAYIACTWTPNESHLPNSNIGIDQTQGEIIMAKIFGFTPLELHPGVDEKEFIKFFVEQYAPLGARLGWKGYVLKADQGERAGMFAVIWEIPSVEQRDRFVLPDKITEEGHRLLDPEFGEMNKKLGSYVKDWPFTDYIEQGV
jgi:hypothetical protein